MLLGFIRQFTILAKMNPPLSNCGATNRNGLFTFDKNPTDWNNITDGVEVILSVKDVGDCLGLLSLAMGSLTPVVDVAFLCHDDWWIAWKMGF